MAYVKIIAIRSRLDHTVAYAADLKKTSVPEDLALAKGIDYATDEEKMEQHILADAINCFSVETAFREMLETKQRFFKTDGVQGYHVIQSFAPGEVSAEEAHRIGLELAEKLFGDRFEVVVGTHLNRAHYHNHIVFNSVSFQDGKRYHSSPDRYYKEIRKASNELCRAHGLSVIQTNGHGKSYAEWQAEQNNRPTIRSMIRADIDDALKSAYDLESFYLLLERCGYTVNRNPNRKYITVKPPWGERAIRLDSLGDGYRQDDIKQKLAEGRIKRRTTQKQRMKQHRYRVMQPVRRPFRKLTGFPALYFRYVYLLRGIQRRRCREPQAVRQMSRKEVLRLRRYQRQFLYLLRENICTEQALSERIDMLSEDIQLLTDKRKDAYRARYKARKADAPQGKYNARIAVYSGQLRTARRELELCRGIAEDIPLIRAKQEELAAGLREERSAREQTMRKEVRHHEHKR